MRLIDEIRDLQEESYDKWFERWYEKKDIERLIKESAMQGYHSVTLRVSEEDDFYTRRRLEEARVIEKIKGKIPGFDVSYITNSVDRMFLDFDLGTEYKKVILISWRD